MKSSAGFVRPIGTMQTQRRRRAAIKENIPRGIRLVSALVMVQGRPTENLPTEHLALTDSLQPAAAFYPADVLRMMDTLKGIYRHWQIPVRQKKRLSPMDLSPMGSPLMGGQLFYRHQFSRAAAEKEKKKSLRKLLVINGPNLNFLGIREKGIYGTQDYNDLLNMIAQKGLDCHAAISVFQSNHEGAIIDKIQEAYFDKTEGIIINPGAYTHYSYAIRDALASITVPKVEIHISNIMEREDFRKVSVTAPVCDKQIYGHGLNGYLEAIDFVLEKLDEQE